MPHPYRALLDFALQTYDNEIARASQLAGKRPQGPSEWGPHFRQCERVLKELETAALTAENHTQFPITEIERRVRNLARSCLAILIWQRDGRDGAVEYLFANYNRMMGTAWPEMETPTLQVEADPKVSWSKEIRKPIAKRTRPNKTRRRVPRTVLLLLALLEDRTKSNLNLSELAALLEVNVSSVSRAFHHKKYGPQLRKRYEDYGVPPPRIREI